MNRRGAGVVFCAVAAFLYAVNFFAAVWWMPHITEWGTPPGRLGTAYNVVGRDLQYLAVIVAIIGVVLLLVGEISEAKQKEKP